ncbi:MAG: ABC transporter permease, partial [Burkholderiales bacterium]
MLRLLLAIPTIFCVAVIVFVLMRIVPGDPISMMIPPGASPDDIENLREIYGLNKPVLDQFLIWLNGIAEGDLGRSISLKLGVGQLILNRLPATLELVILSLGMAIFLAVTASVAAIRYKDTLVERVLDTFTGVAQAIPDFLWSLLLLLFFG